MKKTFLLTAVALMAAMAVCTGADEKKPAAHGHGAAAAEPPPAVTPSPKDAKVYIISPKDGATIASGKKTVVKFGLKGMGVCPAGLYKENTGHHHLLIDMDKSELPPGIPIPTIEGKCLHYGAGQTEVELELAPGKHTLQLVLGNYSHMLHEPPVISEKITITVE